jgi:hypothetical protein
MKKIFVFFLFVAGFSSCKKVLQEIPQSFITSSNFYKNGSDAESAITGVYSSLADNYGITYWLLLVNQADYENGRGSQAPISDFSQILNPTNIERVAAVWSSFYRTVNRANAVINNVPKINMDPTIKNRILAEAHFLRAMAYFDLVRGWGAVPIKTKGK